MQLIPVIDLLDGIVVRGVAGQRNDYRPVQSRLTDSAAALDVARAFRDHLGLSRLYVADLDAILHNRPNLDLYRKLLDDGFDLLLDAGLRDVDRVSQLLEAGVPSLVAGLETLSGRARLSEFVERAGAPRLVFSLDLKGGAPLTAADAWGTSDPFEIASQTFALGVRRIIVLDLAGVGVGQGVPTAPLCAQIREHNPHIELITGGGVRGLDDLFSLKRIGVNGVLVASSLHDGTITANDIRSLNQPAR